MAIDPRAIRRVAFASVIGATVEWYDFFLYGVVAGIVFNKLYFPADDPLVSTLLAYSTFAVGFVTRPLGGVLFGHFGDRIGRKSALILTLVIMGISTAGVAFVPTYAQIGIWAPVLLLSLRVLQGIGLGGEWGGAVLMAYEYAPPEKRGLYASLPQIGLSIGLCLASGIVAGLSRLLSEAAFLSWGWRIAFGASLGLVLIGLYIRSKVMETPEFLAVKRSRGEVRIPFTDMITRYRGAVMLGMGARYIDGVFFNIFAVFSIGYQSGDPESYTLKLDVRKFFYRIDRTILRRLIERKIKDKRLVDVMMLFADLPEPLGIPIGNLLSQIYALVYLNALDHFVKRELKVKLYCRYVDDFILFNLTREQCLEYKARVVAFLRDELHLDLSKWTMAKTKRGVNFVGYRTWRRAKFIRKYSLFKFRRAAKRGKVNSVISILGHAKYTHSLGFMWRTIREVNPGLVSKLPPKVRRFYPAKAAEPTGRN